MYLLELFMLELCAWDKQNQRAKRLMLRQVK
jgi:hypothetical protein